MKVTINCSEIEEDERTTLARQIEDIILQLQEKAGVDISTMVEVIIPHEFDNELVAFQKAHGLDERGRTRDDSGIAACKVLKHQESGQTYQTVFLDKEYWLVMLLSGEKSGTDLAVHLLHHELAHVQENQYAAEIFGDDFPLPYKNNLQALLRGLARIVWEEYYANRTAGGTMPLEHACGMSGLYETVEYASTEMDRQVASYRYHGDIESLWTSGIELCRRLMYSIGSSLGYFHYHKAVFSEDGECIQEAEKKVGESLNCLESVWTNAAEALDSLYSTYPKWQGSEDLDNLAEVVLRTFNILGLHPRQEGKGVYIDVPFKDDEIVGGEES